MKMLTAFSSACKVGFPSVRRYGKMRPLEDKRLIETTKTTPTDEQRPFQAMTDSMNEREKSATTGRQVNKSDSTIK